MWTPAQADFLTGYLNSSSIQLQVAAVTFPAKKSAKNLSHPASLIYMHILYTHMHTTLTRNSSDSPFKKKKQ